MTSILLVPSPEWRGRLFHCGPCGATPPTAIARFEPVRQGVEPGYAIHETEEWACPGCNGHTGVWRSQADAAKHIEHLRGCRFWALVLAWDGVVVPEGMDRATRCLAEREGLDASAGFLWCTYRDEDKNGQGGPILAWTLGTAHRGRDYWLHESSGAPAEQLVEAAASPPATLPEALLSVWALAIVCAARGLGECVVAP